MANGPLAGIKVLEVAGIGPGPFCGMMLAVMGAERGIKFAATVPSLDAVMIDAAGTVYVTPDLESRFQRITR